MSNDVKMRNDVPLFELYFIFPTSKVLQNFQILRKCSLRIGSPKDFVRTVNDTFTSALKFKIIFSLRFVLVMTTKKEKNSQKKASVVGKLAIVWRNMVVLETGWLEFHHFYGNGGSNKWLNSSFNGVADDLRKWIQFLGKYGEWMNSL